MLTAVIAATVAEGEKVLACAPSNRAVHALCSMFMAKHPTVAVALVGTVDSLAAASAGYTDSSFDLTFVHGWATRMATRFASSASAIAAAKRTEGGSVRCRKSGAEMSPVFSGVAHLIRWMLWRAPSTLAEILSDQSASAFPWELVASSCEPQLQMTRVAL